MRKIVVIIVAVCLSAGLILSIPLLHLLLEENAFEKKEKRQTQIAVKKIKVKKTNPKPKRKLRKPKRVQPKQRNIKSGPRFAMNLNVAGLGGAAIPMDLINTQRGNGAGETGDVDERPSIAGNPPFSLPEAVRKKELDALAVVSFCVNTNGQAYELQLLEERPVGFGLGDAALRAIRDSSFEPAKKDGKAVAFCGMEQPFEVKFND